MPFIKVPPSVKMLDRAYSGYIFVSDIDKTYLATEINSLGGLLRAAFETPERKNNVPGFSLLLRAVRRGGAEEEAKNPLFFLSASPEQMASKLHAKMELDKISYDGVIYKNQLENVRRGKLGKLKEQIGYKLEALLLLWKDLPKNSKLVFFGDDSESDALVYSLFSYIVAKKIGGRDLGNLLERLGVYSEDVNSILEIAAKYETPVEPLKGVFINLATGAQPQYVERYAPFIYATENSLQAACKLFEQSLIRIQALRSIVKDMMVHHDFPAQEILESLERGCDRGLYKQSTWYQVRKDFIERGLLPEQTIVRSQEDLELKPEPPQHQWGFENLRPSATDIFSLYLR